MLEQVITYNIRQEQAGHMYDLQMVTNDELMP